MAYPAFLATPDNVVTSATLSDSSADTNYPITNVNVLPISLPWRTTGITSEYVEFDLGSAKNVSFIAVINHNYTSAATITLKGGASPNPTTFTQSITWRQYDAFVLFSVQNYRYWRLTIADSTNPSTYLSTGYVLLGNYTQMAEGFAWAYQFADVYTNLQLNTEFNVPHVAPLAYQVKLGPMVWNQLSDTNMTVLRSLFKECQKNIYPFFFVIDSSVNEGYFVRFSADFTRIMDVNRSATVTLIEDSRGKVIGA